MSLSKYDPCHDIGEGPDREEFRSGVLLPMYLSTVYPSSWAHITNGGLMRNDLNALADLLNYEACYDNSTGRLSHE